MARENLQHADGQTSVHDKNIVDGHYSGMFFLVAYNWGILSYTQPLRPSMPSSQSSIAVPRKLPLSNERYCRRPLSDHNINAAGNHTADAPHSTRPYRAPIPPSHSEPYMPWK
ncbi:hypothetical protein AcW1_002082 [Taiwanofungus camphoratus]|nr:hypothetical protein AcW1_002082 [Antrodia cinnamomea]